MTLFTNPISAAADEAQDYIAAVLELLGDRDPLAVLDELEGAIRVTVEGLSDESLRRPEAPGKWSIIEVVQHLADSELVWAYRMRTVLADADPQLTGYDQDRWSERLRYSDTAIDDALEQIAVLRKINLGLLRRLEPAELERAGRHSERGEESIEHMIRLYAGHDLVHRRQLERIRAQL